ncbi:MAG: hypothetical protein D6E12_16835 [Desulfovibrio sp.]|nr:MAG: hypothetical protein D6E12_16835 [Desulfovibrio sp.]
MPTTMRDRAWAMIMEAERFSDTAIAKTLRMQYRAYLAARVNGPSMPLILEPGEKPIEPFIFQDGGEILERAIGKLISMRT